LEVVEGGVDQRLLQLNLLLWCKGEDGDDDANDDSHREENDDANDDGATRVVVGEDGRRKAELVGVVVTAARATTKPKALAAVLRGEGRSVEDPRKSRPRRIVLVVCCCSVFVTSG
jgi:hypothetical protein